MRAGQSLHAMRLEHLIEQAAGATVGIGDKHPLTRPVDLLQLAPHRLGDALGVVVQLRG
ncbi:hypothetical protein D3C72_2483640 [compost metagenome]